MTSPEERTDVPGVSRELADNVELVHFPEEEDRPHVPLTELATMLSGSRQHEEELEENLSANFSQESEVLLPDAARATLPEHQSFWRWAWGRIKDVFVITHLAARLWPYVAKGWAWFINFWRLVLFATILFPGFAQMIVFYFFSPRLLRSLVFGSQPRNRLDVFVPRQRWRKRGPLPTVVFITGGAWTIGYKAWGALLGRRLSQRGVLVFCLDYRNFPQGKATDMLEDVNRGIAWVINNAELYGGDPGCLYIVGQSAGGHLGSLALMAQCARTAANEAASGGGIPKKEGAEVEKEPAVAQGPAAPAKNIGASELTDPATDASVPVLAETDPLESAPLAPSSDPVGEWPAWNPALVRGFVGVSGAYDLVTLADHLDARGLNREMFGAIMSLDGRPALARLSPARVVRALAPGATARMPPVLLLHGTADKSVPVQNALDYALALEAAGVPVRLKLYKGKTHTQPIVEDPMRGGRDELMDDVLELVTGKPQSHFQFPMLPSFLIDWATYVCPF